MDSTKIFWYLATVILGYLLTDIIKIVLAKQLKNKLTPILIYRIKRGMGVLLIVFGAIMMLKSFIPKEHMDNIIEKVEKPLKPHD